MSEFRKGSDRVRKITPGESLYYYVGVFTACVVVAVACLISRAALWPTLAVLFLFAAGRAYWLLYKQNRAEREKQ